MKQPTKKELQQAQQTINKVNNECNIGFLKLELLGFIKYDENGNITPTQLGKNYFMLSECLKSGLDKDSLL